MALVELVRALQGRHLKGFGAVLWDVNDLPALNKRLKMIRDQVAELKKIEKRLKPAILSHPDAKVGYSDDYIKITETTSPDTSDSQLIELLKEKGLWDRVSIISTSKLREVAEEDEDVASAIRWQKSRKLNKRRKRKKRT